jgi:hypothetical protein
MTATITERDPKFYTKHRRLTEYAFACGYSECRTEGDVITTIWREHGTYHIRQSDFSQTPVVRVFWHSFPNLGPARFLFDQQPGELGV